MTYGLRGAWSAGRFVLGDSEDFPRGSRPFKLGMARSSTATRMTERAGGSLVAFRLLALDFEISLSTRLQP